MKDLTIHSYEQEIGKEFWFLSSFYIARLKKFIEEKEKGEEFIDSKIPFKRIHQMFVKENHRELSIYFDINFIQKVKIDH